MLLGRSPDTLPELSERVSSLCKRGRGKRAWHLCLNFERRNLDRDGPAWLLSEEGARCSLLQADAALAAGAFERAYFSAKLAGLVLSGWREDGEEDLNSGAVKRAGRIANEAFAALSEGDREGVEHEWEKLRSMIGAPGRIRSARGVMAADWELSGGLRRWFARRALRRSLASADLFGKWATPG